MSNDRITMMEDTFENGQTHEAVQGITIIIDGKLKQVIDLIKQKNPNYETTMAIVRDAFIMGLNDMIKQ